MVVFFFGRGLRRDRVYVKEKGLVKWYIRGDRRIVKKIC